MNKINICKLTKNQILELCKQFCDDIGVNFKVVNSKKIGGSYVHHKKELTISSYHNKDVLVFMFFHEVGHWYCYNTSKWLTYHTRNTIMSTNFKKTGLLAERWCDTFSEKICNEYFTNVYCYKPYHTEYGRKYHRKIWGLN